MTRGDALRLVELFPNPQDKEPEFDAEIVDDGVDPIRSSATIMISANGKRREFRIDDLVWQAVGSARDALGESR